MNDLQNYDPDMQSWTSLHTPVRNVLAVFRFRGGPGRETEAAEAWAFELTCFFQRGVGEAPQVEYSGGIYTCTGLMTTTHPGDSAPVTEFSKGEPVDLNWVTDPHRRTVLREMHNRLIPLLRFDGRDNEGRNDLDEH